MRAKKAQKNLLDFVLKFSTFVLVGLIPINLGRHFWPEYSYVLGIRVDYLSPTVFVSDLIAAFLIITFLISLFFKYQKISKTILYLIIVLFVFTLIFLGSSFFRADFWLGIYQLFRIVQTFLLAIIISVVLNTKRDQRILFLILAAAIIFESALAFLQFYFQASMGLKILGEGSFNSQTPGISLVDLYGKQLLRPYGTFPHPNVLAGFLTITLPLIYYQLTSEIKIKVRYFLILGLFCGLFILGLSFSRTAWVATLACFVLIGVLTKGKSLVKNLLRNPKQLTLIIILIITFFGLFGPLVLERFITLSSTDVHTVSLRSKLNSSAIEMFKDSPLVGVGFGRFLTNLPQYFVISETIRVIQPVHNIVLLILAESGLVGLGILLIMFYLVIAFLLVKIRKKEIFAKILISTLLGIFIISNFDHYLFTLNQGRLMLALILGLSLTRTTS
ncbi:MAG TPA: O-antigen ligase family protein [Patescibacteria group bacterium]